jgi:predicted small secreted protein
MKRCGGTLFALVLLAIVLAACSRTTQERGEGASDMALLGDSSALTDSSSLIGSLADSSITAQAEAWQAERIVRRYLDAIAAHKIADARATLAPSLAARTEDADLSLAAGEASALTLRTFQIHARTANRVVGRAVVTAQVNAPQSGVWVNGENERWVALDRTPSGWRIAEIATAPIALEGTSATESGTDSLTPTVTKSHTNTEWQRVDIPEANLSIDAPGGWTRFGNEWSWAPASVQPQTASRGKRVGVTWQAIGPGWKPTSVLPKNAHVIETTSLTVGGRRVTRYRVEVVAPPAEGGEHLATETHVIVTTPEKMAYDVYASAPTALEIIPLDNVLEHMVASIKRSPTPPR